MSGPTTAQSSHGKVGETDRQTDNNNNKNGRETESERQTDRQTETETDVRTTKKNKTKNADGANDEGEQTRFPPRKSQSQFTEKE